VCFIIIQDILVHLLVLIISQSVSGSVNVVITVTRHPVLASGLDKQIMAIGCLSVRK
jgi:hypothetical protein